MEFVRTATMPGLHLLTSALHRVVVVHYYELIIGHACDKGMGLAPTQERTPACGKLTDRA
eukprot:scaffold119138_cov31-Tisochrysis_lutea.AAC.1